KLRIEAAGSVRQHGVDLAGLRGEIGARHHLPAIFARDFVQEALKLGDVAVDRLHEFAIRAILAADLLERALTLHRIKLAREDIALAAVVAVPQLGGGGVIEHAGNVDRDGIKRFDGMTLASCGIRLWLAERRLVVLRSTREQVGEPTAARRRRRRGRAHRGGFGAAGWWWRRRRRRR